MARALLTDAEREILSGERDVSDSRVSAIRTDVKRKIQERFEEDMEILEENHEDLYGLALQRAIHPND